MAFSGNFVVLEVAVLYRNDVSVHRSDLRKSLIIVEAQRRKLAPHIGAGRTFRAKLVGPPQSESVFAAREFEAQIYGED
jgi:hypothetical protein